MSKKVYEPEKRPEDHGYVRVLGDLLVVHAAGLGAGQIHKLAVNNRRLLALMQAKAKEAKAAEAEAEANLDKVLEDTAETMTTDTAPQEEAMDEEARQSWIAEIVREEEPMMTRAEAVEYFGASGTAFKKWAEQYLVYPVIKNRCHYYRVSDVEMLKAARDRSGRRAYTKKK